MRRIVKATLLCAVLAIFVGLASATTITQGPSTFDGVTFTVSFDNVSGLVDLKIDAAGCTYNGSPCDGIGVAAVHLFNSYGNASDSGHPSGWDPVTNGNAGGNDHLNCNTQGAPGWLCWTATGINPAIDGLEFKATVTDWNLITGAWNIQLALFNGEDFLTNISEPLTVQTPEPSSFMLLGSGVLGLIAIIRRRIHA